MRYDDESALLEAVSCCHDATFAINEVSHSMLDAKDDVMGIKGKIAKARDTLTRVQEMLDHADAILLDLVEGMKQCGHPTSAHVAYERKFWSCAHCGDIWSGLKWVTQSEDPLSKV